MTDIASIVATEAATYWQISADLAAAERNGNIAKQEYMHAELDMLRIHATSPTLRRLAAERLNVDMAERVYDRAAC